MLASWAPGCDCIFPFDDEPRPRRDGGDGFLVNEEPRPECFQERELDLGMVLDAGLPAVPPDGVSTVSLSPAGCYRFRSTVEGGVLKQASVLHSTGEFRVEVDAGLIAAYNVEKELMRVDYLSDFDAPSVQNQTASCYANSENTFSANQNAYNCSAEVMERLRQELNLALTRYWECLSKRAGPVGDNGGRRPHLRLRGPVRSTRDDHPLRLCALPRNEGV